MKLFSPTGTIIVFILNNQIQVMNHNFIFNKTSGIRSNWFYTICLGVIFMSSCKKSEVEDLGPVKPVTPVTQTDDYVPVYPDADAVMVSIKNVSYENIGGNLYETTVGKAKAIFPSKTGELVNAGDVSVENQPLNCESGNRYSFEPDPLAPEGIPFNTNKARWSVSGNTNIPNMNFINTTGFPEVSPLANDPQIVDRTTEFTYGLVDAINNADSVRFTISSSNGFIYATVAAKNNSITFAASKLQLLSAGEGTLKITAFKTVKMVINQKNIQALNQSVISKKVTIL